MKLKRILIAVVILICSLILFVFVSNILFDKKIKEEVSQEEMLKYSAIHINSDSI